ncbi:cell wall-binding repeat-containing protein [Fusobacterium sp.]|uniref:cell wall-binding repeat-containing protein n=1 Tax=Fusobacterium sp. TaxID=68766 RepID=UPI00261BEA3A|nr:cell wall-binding repeat-containing protein [Fusobacterium sp.]
MNKKRLSVVMAGAMLASAVAPVLAATPQYEVNGSNRGLLIKELRELMLSKTFANEAVNKEFAGECVFYVQMGKGLDVKQFYTVESIPKMEEAINAAPVGTVIEVVNGGYVEKNGKYYHFALEDKVTETEKTFNKASLKEAADKFKANKENYPAIYSMDFDGETLTVELRKAADETKLETVTFKAGDKELDFSKPVDVNGDVLDGRTPQSDWSDLATFKPVVSTETIKKGDPIDEKVVARLTVSDADSKVNVKLSDLYDGLLLTSKGQELLDKVKEANAVKNDGLYVSVADVKTSKNGIFTFDMEFVNTNPTTNKYEKNVITISSNNKGQLEIFNTWMKRGQASVEVLAGTNRYETAVKVAKENAKIEDVALNGNIVLVNGNALVDGLAAAPLAASVVNKIGNIPFDGYVAPILLTETNSLPKATLQYMKELVKHQTVGSLDQVTVYLVGGEAVISQNVVNQLKSIGVRVVRAGGEDREATSLAVAKLMENDNDVDVKNAFLVGADGEADAMSIASVAAQKKQPIIVESRKGLSDSTVDYLKGGKFVSAKSATIIGGETVVSGETEAKLKEEKVSVDRVAGSNRKATNAKVIDRFASNYIQRVVLSKDGQTNKSELIDALTATSLAVKDNAPIVLATNKMSNEQVNALEKKANRNGVYVYQVGHGVARDVLKQIATRIGLAK